MRKNGVGGYLAFEAFKLNPRCAEQAHLLVVHGASYVLLHSPTVGNLFDLACIDVKNGSRRLSRVDISVEVFLELWAQLHFVAISYLRKHNSWTDVTKRKASPGPKVGSLAADKLLC